MKSIVNRGAQYLRLITIVACVSLLFITNSWAATLPGQSLIYNTDLMVSFNVKEYLGKKAPHLVQHAEAISHWSGRSTINPQILLALMEQQTGILSGVTDLERPFGSLSAEHGFVNQLRDVANRLAYIHYNSKAQGGPSTASVLKAFFAKANELANLYDTAAAASDVNSVADIYSGFFPQQNTAQALQQPAAAQAALPPSNLLQLPFPVNQSWRHGGPHSYTGSGLPMSSMDYHDGGRWGDNLGNKWVVASASGRVVIHSSCHVEVLHDGGWSTTYYHLENIQVSNNQNVSRNQRLSNYANDKPQALCDGGSSSGPHQHWSLKQNGSYVSLDQVVISGWTFHVNTTTNYDTNCNRFWLTKPGSSKHCASSALRNDGVSDTPPPPPPSNDVVIVDNQDSNTSSNGSWSTSSGSSPYNGNSVYCNSGCTFTWAASLPSSGQYEVYAWWTTHANRSTNVPYTVGSTTVNVNQQANGGKWNLLTSGNFSSGTNNVVISSSNGQANADAIRFVKLP